MSNINTIRLSGTTYQIEDSNASKTVELTQAQYDALVNKDPNTFYVITDAEAGDLTQYWTSAQTQSAINQAVSGKASQTDLETVSGQVANKQETLVSGTNIKTINNESLLGSGNITIQGGGGKAIEAGRGISITTGETADTVSFNLPISADSNNNITIGALNLNNDKGKELNFLFGGSNGVKTPANYDGKFNCIFGFNNYVGKAQGRYATQYNAMFGSSNHCYLNNSLICGNNNATYNNSEFSSGQYNNSVSGSSTFGDSGNTLFSVGNGTSANARHNAFEIRQNGDIYITSGGTDIKLQDNLGGGGGSSYTAGDGIDITNDVISVTGKADTSAVTAIQDSLSGYVTTDTEQIISGRKIFTYSAGSSKAIEFKQAVNSSKVGFRVITSAATNNELATFEFRPNTFTVNGVHHPLLYLGHYRNINTASGGIEQTVIGFRQYDQLNEAAYHYLLPLPERAKTPFSLTTSFKNYYAPMGFKNGSTMITADDTGVVDLSSELGGLKLVKLSQAEYDALATKDSNTLYVIVN